jgi:hypothetical protein
MTTFYTMLQSKIWIFYRIASTVIGILAFSQAICVNTNFDFVAGLICGTFFFLFVLFVVSKNSVVTEQIFLLASPCWPPGKYPQAYWFASGVNLFVSALVNLMFHLSNPAAVDLYSGLLLLGLGGFSGAMLAHYRVKKRSR